MSIKDDVARRVTLKAQKERIEQEIALIDERLRQNPLGTHDAGDWSLQLSPNRRLNAARFEARFPVAQYPSYYEPKVSTKAIQEFFAPVELEQFYDSGEPIVRVK